VPDPTIGQAFTELIKKTRGLSPSGAPTTFERVEATYDDGTAQVLGQRIPISGIGPVQVGERVVVAWKDKRPLTIIKHSARRTTVETPSPRGGKIVEELFIATNNGVLDIWFRNANQNVPLGLSSNWAGSPANLNTPIEVRWGQDRAHFVVRTGTPTAGDITNQGAHPYAFLRIVQEFYVFELTRQSETTPVGSFAASATLTGKFQPYGANGTFNVYSFVTHFHAEAAVWGQKFDKTQTVGAAFVSIVTDDDVEADTVDDRTVTRSLKLQDILNGVNTEFTDSISLELVRRVFYGTIQDFGTSRDGKLMLVLLFNLHNLGDTLSSGGTGSITGDALTSSGGVGNPTPEAPGDPDCAVTTVSAARNPQVVQSPIRGHFGGGSFGEGHFIVVNMQDQTVTWMSLKNAATLEGIFRTTIRYNPMLVKTLFSDSSPPGSGTTCSFNLFSFNLAGTGVTERLSFTDPDGSGWITRKMHLWEETKFPFIDASANMLDVDSTSLVTESNLYTPFSSGTVSVPPISSLSVLNIGVRYIKKSFEEPGNWTYRIKQSILLESAIEEQGAERIPAVIAVVVDRVRRLVPVVSPFFGKEIGAFVVTDTGQLLATLSPFTTTNVATAATNEDRFALGNVKDDGSNIILMAGNRYHVVWRKEKDAVIQVFLTHAQSNTTIQIGIDLAKYQSRGLLVLKRDWMYDTKEDEAGRKFVEAWDFDTGAPSLSIAAQDFPPEDVAMQQVKQLLDLEDGQAPLLAATSYQVINSQQILSPVGRFKEEGT